MENLEKLIDNLCELEDEVKILGSSINNAGVEWKDKKFEELSGEIKVLATHSKVIMQAR